MSHEFGPFDDVPSSNLERTARWVEAQARQTYDDSPSSPSSSTKQPSSNRTTTSSDQSMLHRAIPLPSPLQLPPTQSPQMQAQRSRGRKASIDIRTPLPFPQSPPGSGYPVMLDVDPPRAVAGLERTRSHSQNQSKQGSIPRPTYAKKRRPSLLGQIIALGTPSSTRKRDDSEK
ncbi:unnamed protein product [Somion occarium]|uniref:Uncharacterized protein n=1 Tax=Somion occarium TaxID=3059160 RepID=A0ABP1DXD0_9APHY